MKESFYTKEYIFPFSKKKIFRVLVHFSSILIVSMKNCTRIKQERKTFFKIITIEVKTVATGKRH